MAYGSRINKTLFLQYLKNGVFYFVILVIDQNNA